MKWFSLLIFVSVSVSVSVPVFSFASQNLVERTVEAESKGQEPSCRTSGNYFRGHDKSVRGSDQRNYR
jgi:hypothetical protein